MTEKSDGKLFFPGEEWRNEIKKKAHQLRLTGFKPMSPVSAPFRHFSPFSS